LVIRQRPDVAFIDLGLPELDGRGVARQVKAQLGADGPRLVAMTGFSQPDHVHGATEAGFDAYIVKPSSPEEIQRVLSRPMR
jgi:CheY-like chemotaxis protein